MGFGEGLALSTTVAATVTHDPKGFVARWWAVKEASDPRLCSDSTSQRRALSPGRPPDTFLDRADEVINADTTVDELRARRGRH
jgi:hypothetical protein